MKHFIQSAPLVLEESLPLFGALEHIKEAHTHVFLVKDHEGVITGIVCVCDLLKYWGQKDQAIGSIATKHFQYLRYEHLLDDLTQFLKDFDRSCYPVFRNADKFYEHSLVGLLDVREVAKVLFKNLSRRRIHSLLEKSSLTS